MKFRRLYEEEISPKKIRKDLWDKFKKLSEEEIISLAGGEINEIKPFTPMLISKGGKLLSVADSNIPTDVMLNGDRRKAVHADYTNATVYSLLKRDYPELKWDDMFSHLLAEDYGLLGQEHLSDNLGFVRLNTGTTAVEKRFYMVLPISRPSAGQWDWIEKYLEDGASHNAGEVLVYGNGGDDFHFYSFREYTPEEILGKLKRYYASGKFYEELNEVYPNKGESKEDFISRFMRATVKEYPDKEQRFAVANSDWDRRNKKKVNEAKRKDLGYEPSEFNSEVDYFGHKLSPEQAEYFKDSVVRIGGKLLPVYHGASGDFSRFERGHSDRHIKNRQGFYWAAFDKEYANDYSDNVYAGYLNIKRILDIGDIDSYIDYDKSINEIASLIKVSTKEVENQMERMNYDYLYQLTGSKWFMDRVKRLGYDGVLAWESGLKTFGFIDSNQFKLIDNKTPTSSNNINESISNTPITVYRVGQVDNFDGGLFFTDDLSYFDHSAWDRRNKKSVSETFDVDGNLYNPSKYSGIEINDNFKKWFQKGGITDPYHDPLIVYHGSRYDFDSFVPNSYAGEFPDAIYFTDNKKIADTYETQKSIS